VPAPKHNNNRVARHRIARIANQKISLLNGLDRKFVMPPINENFGWMLSRPEELKAEAAIIST
jgi:hypothetical protein